MSGRRKPIAIPSDWVPGGTPVFNPSNRGYAYSFSGDSKPQPQPRLSNRDDADAIPLKKSSSAHYGIFLVNFNQPDSSNLTTIERIDTIYQNYDQDGIWRFVITGIPFNPNYIINSIVPVPTQGLLPQNLAVEIQKEVRIRMNDLAEGFKLMSEINDLADEGNRPKKRLKKDE